VGDIIPFDFEGQAVRAMEIEGQPWFVGKDVADRLGYTNPSKAMSGHCKGGNETAPPSNGWRDAASPPSV